MKVNITADALNSALKEAAAEGAMKGILGYCAERALVSIDFNHFSNSSTVDALSTKVLERAGSPRSSPGTTMVGLLQPRQGPHPLPRQEGPVTLQAIQNDYALPQLAACCQFNPTYSQPKTLVILSEAKNPRISSASVSYPSAHYNPFNISDSVVSRARAILLSVRNPGSRVPRSKSEIWTSWTPDCSARSICRQLLARRNFLIRSPNATPNIRCHSSMVGLVFTLYLAHTLSCSRKVRSYEVPWERCPPILILPILIPLAGCSGATSNPALNMTGIWSVTTVSTQGQPPYGGLSGTAAVSQSGEGLGVNGATTFTAILGKHCCFADWHCADRDVHKFHTKS